jgi:hypothetical protein
MNFGADFEESKKDCVAEFSKRARRRGKESKNLKKQ